MVVSQRMGSIVVGAPVEAQRYCHQYNAHYIMQCNNDYKDKTTKKLQLIVWKCSI